MENPAVFFAWKGDEGQVGEGCEADRTKRIVVDSITQTIPMNPLGRESCSAEASTIPGFHLHCLEGNRSTYIWKSACSTVSNDFLGVLESSERELMETQIILNCAVTTLFIL